MATQLLGTYTTEEEAANAVDVYALGGLLKENMTILTNKNYVNSLEDHTSVSIKTDTPIEAGERESEGVMDKLKDMFTSDDDFELHSHEQLTSFGLTDSEATRCLRAVENGEIVLLAEDEMRMGHDDNMLDDGVQ